MAAPAPAVVADETDIDKVREELESSRRILAQAQQLLDEQREENQGLIELKATVTADFEENGKLTEKSGGEYYEVTRKKEQLLKGQVEAIDEERRIEEMERKLEKQREIQENELKTLKLNHLASLQKIQKDIKKRRKKTRGLMHRLERKMKKVHKQFSWKICSYCNLEYTLEPHRLPRVLKCGHTLCTTCVESRTESRKLVCKIDKKVERGIESAEHLPINKLLINK